MTYKFIGTRQDLLDNGYIEVNDLWYEKELDNIFINITLCNSLYNTNIIAIEYRKIENIHDKYKWFEYKKNIKSFIQDLIDKGLVKVYE